MDGRSLVSEDDEEGQYAEHCCCHGQQLPMPIEVALAH